MSSGRFATVIRPDRRLRRAVAAFAAAALAGGGAMLLHLPLAPPLTGLLLAAWLAQGVREIGALARGTARVRALGIDAEGHWFARGRDGRRLELELLAGSIVGARLAWLHLAFTDGTRYGELLSGRPEDASWRRLRASWRRA